MARNGLPFLKAIGVRIHTVRYQRVRKRMNRKQRDDKSERDDEDWQASKEYKRIRGTHAAKIQLMFTHAFTLLIETTFVAC